MRVVLHLDMDAFYALVEQRGEAARWKCHGSAWRRSPRWSNRALTFGTEWPWIGSLPQWS